jgi:hypothetical protein
MKNGWIVEHVANGGEAPVAPEKPADILKDAEALEAGSALPYIASLTGKIVSIDSEYSEQYGNITVTIEVDGTDGKTIQGYRIKGEDAATLAVGDTITITGSVINYNGNIQFNTGSTLVLVAKGEIVPPAGDDEEKEEIEDEEDVEIDEEIDEEIDVEDETSPETGDIVTTFVLIAMILAAAALVFSYKLKATKA